MATETIKAEQRYTVEVELTDHGRRVIWDGLVCYATSPDAAAQNTLRGFTARAKAIVRRVVDNSGKTVYYAPADGE